VSFTCFSNSCFLPLCCYSCRLEHCFGLFFSLRVAASFHPILQYCVLSLASMDLDSSGLFGRTLLDASLRYLTPDPLHMPNSPHTQIFNRSTNFQLDRMHDTCTTPDLSLMVSALSIVCALRFIYFFRTHCHPPWNFDLVVQQRTNCWPVGMLPTFSLNLSSNTKDERSPKWRTRFGCRRRIL
jgi:hypothetical protein